MTTIQKVDELATGDAPSEGPIFVILQSGGGSILADASYLRSWLRNQGNDREVARHIVGLVENGCSVHFHPQADTMTVRLPASPA